MKAILRHIYLCRTANMTWGTCVVVKKIQSNPIVPKTTNWLSPLWWNTDHWPYVVGVCIVTEMWWWILHSRSLNALFETIPETCIVEFLWEAGLFYMIWCNFSTSTSPQTFTLWSGLCNYSENESNSETFTCVRRLICHEGRVSLLNKSNSTNYSRKFQRLV